MANPNYEEVSTGNAGHAEAVEIVFNPNIITYESLLDIFFKTHDPTTINQQGADTGAQYRSIVFYSNEDQKNAAESGITKAQKNYKDLIVTLILPLEKFWKAEDYHQDYYNNNKEANYCKAVIDPKIKKLFKEFPTAVSLQTTQAPLQLTTGFLFPIPKTHQLSHYS